MKLLKAESNSGFFRNEAGQDIPIDKIGKEDLLQLVNWTLQEEIVEFDEYDEQKIKNQAQQVIYKSVARKLLDLRTRRAEFADQAARLYLDDYERYRSESPKSDR